MSRIAGFYYKSKLDNANRLIDSMGRGFMQKSCGRTSSLITTPLARAKTSVIGLARAEITPEKTSKDEPGLLSNNHLVLAIIDGAIHNREELIDKLKLRNRKSLLEDDARLLSEGYISGGEEFFRTINGEFAFLLYDRRKDIFYAVRDRFGTHLLFYAQIGNNFIFASEIKSLFADHQLSSKPNFQTVYRYAFSNYRYAYGTEETFFQDVIQVPGNCILAIKYGKVDKQALWKFSCDDLSHISDVEAARTFHELLEKSLSLRHDPVKDKCAFLLSGGLDSPTVACLAAGRSSTPVTSFSICYKQEKSPRDELDYGESEFIQPTVKMYGMDWHAVYPSADKFAETFADMLNRHDEPISSPTWYSHYTLMKYISNCGYKVIFGGDGGDHALAGLYDDIPYYFADLRQQGNHERLEHEMRCWQKLHDHPVFSKNCSIWQVYLSRCFDWKNPGRILDYTWDEERMRGLYSYELAVHKDFKSFDSSLPLYPSISKRFLISKLWQDLLYTSSPPSNRAEDINLATFGVSNRAVFLDSEFMKFCWGLPGQLMIRDGLVKYLIRYAMKDRLPENVRMKKEHVGLNAPANIWFRGPLRPLMEEMINSDIWQKVGIFNQQRLKDIFEEHLKKKRDHMMFLWKVFSLAKWLQRWRIV